MLESLFTRKGTTKFLLLKDSCWKSGKELLQSFTSMSLARNCKISFLTYDTPPDELKQKYEAYGERFHVIDGYLDPLHWEGIERHGASTVGYDLKEILQTTRGRVVVIDSLTPPLLASSAQHLYQAIHRVLSDDTVEQLTALVNEDVHSNGDMQLLEHLAQSVLTITSSCTCQLLHKKANGKASKTVETFAIDANDEIGSRQVADGSLLVGARREKNESITRDLTFDLTLTETEKEAREKLVLPYTRSRENVQGSKIFYSLDEDEDPDEDLEV